MTFMKLEDSFSTIEDFMAKKVVSTPSFRKFKYSDWGLNQFDVDSIEAFYKEISSHSDGISPSNKAAQYLSLKLGFEPSDSYEYDLAMHVYDHHLGMIQNGNADLYFCQMAHALVEDEINACIKAVSLKN